MGWEAAKTTNQQPSTIPASSIPSVEKLISQTGEGSGLITNQPPQKTWGLTGKNPCEGIELLKDDMWFYYNASFENMNSCELFHLGMLEIHEFFTWSDNVASYRFWKFWHNQRFIKFRWLHSARDFGVVLRGEFHLGERWWKHFLFVFLVESIYFLRWSNFPRKFEWLAFLLRKKNNFQKAIREDSMRILLPTGVVAGKPTRLDVAADSINLGHLARSLKIAPRWKGQEFSGDEDLVWKFGSYSAFFVLSFLLDFLQDGIPKMQTPSYTKKNKLVDLLVELYYCGPALPWEFMIVARFGNPC